jgi:hypothetical protein
MFCNIGSADRILRITLGLSLVGCGFFVAGTTGIVMGVVGLIPLATGSLGNCPAYRLFKINTCQSSNIKSV